MLWHSFRVGLHAPPIGPTSLAALRETLSSSSQSKQLFRRLYGILKCLPVSPPQTFNGRPSIALYKPIPEISAQARYASLWKSKPEEPQRPKGVQTDALKSRAEINAIFGLKVDRKDGNDLLKRLQAHRRLGTLDQKLPYSDALVDKGLAYLRANHPFDEDAAIIARIDRDADREFRLPQTNIDQSPQAVSQFDQLMVNRARLEEKKSKQEREKQKGSAEANPKVGRRVTVRDGTALVQLRPEPEWIQKYRDKAQKVEFSEMSTLERLLPSGLVTIAVIILAVLFAQNYKQPSRKARLWPDLPPAAATVITLIGIKVAVFVLWRIPPFWKFMNRNFLVVPVYPHSVSMLTACFSHQSFTHMLVNVIFLWLIGTRRMSILIPFPSIH